MQMCGRFRTFGRFGKRELIGNVIRPTGHIKSLVWDRATTAWCNAANASKLELNIICTDWPNATQTKEKRTKRDGR